MLSDLPGRADSTVAKHLLDRRGHPSSKEGTTGAPRRAATLVITFYLSLFVPLSQALFAQSQITQVTWTPAGPTGFMDRVVALAVDPRNDSVIYAAAPGGGIWKTQDAGTTWVPLFDSQPSLQVCSLAIDTRSPDTVYVGTGDGQSPRPSQGVVRSTDGGRTWSAAASITNRPVCALAIDPTNPARILAGSVEGLFLSSDSGSGWTKVLTSPVTSIAFTASGVVYAGTLSDESAGARQHNLARSSDGGRTWADLALPRSPSLPTAPTNWVSVATSGSQVFVALSYQSVPFSQLDFFSSDASTLQWYAAFGIGEARPPTALVVNNDYLYLAARNLLLSGDRGSTWTTIPTNTGEFHAVAFSVGTIVLAGEKGLEPVVPGGTPRPISPLPVPQILSVGIDGAGVVWAGGPAGLFGLFPTSTSTQTGVPGIGPVGRVAVVENTLGSVDIFAAGALQVSESTNGGALFSSQTVIPAGELRAPYPPLMVDGGVSSSAYIAGRRLYHTTNSGMVWTALNIVDPDPTRVVTALALAPASRSIFFAATACLPEVTLTSCPPISIVWRSTNAGQTWTQMSVVAGLVNHFAIDPRQSNRVYAAVGGFPAGPTTLSGLAPGNLLLSTNAGASWSSARGNLPRTAINTIEIDSTSLSREFFQPAPLLFVGTDAGVFVSFDAGARWMGISSGLPASPITDLALLQPDGILIAATFGRGVYRASVTGITPGAIVSPLSQEVTLVQATNTNIGLTLSNLSTSAAVDWQLTALDPWLSVPQPNGTLRPLASALVPVSVSAAGLRAGTYVGRLQLTFAFGVQNISVESHVIPAPSRMTIAAGNDASGMPGASLPPLQVLVLDDNQAPSAGIPVTFAITSGGGSLNNRMVTTNSAGIASVILTLPASPGKVQVMASLGTLSVTFTATAVAAPVLSTDGVIDGVTFNSNTSLGPGSVLAISGRNLASASEVAAGALPVSLADARVLLTTVDGDLPLPLFSVSAQDIRALLPFDILPGRYMLHTEVGPIKSNEVEISIADFDPGIFTVNGSGHGPGLFVKDDGSTVTSANPAARGSNVTFYAAGLGAINPAIAAGQPGASAEPLNRTVQVPKVFFDRYSANVVYSGLAPGVPGRYQVTVQVPALVSSATNISVSLTIGGFTSNRVTIPVR